MSRIVAMRALALVVLASGVTMYVFDTFEIGLFFLLTGIGLAFLIWPSRRTRHRGRGASPAAYDWHHNDSGGWGDGGGSDGGGGGGGDGGGGGGD